MDCHLDPSYFFAHNRFTQLQHLSLCRTNFALAHLKVTTLVHLSLSNNPLNPSTTTSQIIQLLALNPSIQILKLHLLALDDDSGPDNGELVPLPHLEQLFLDGKVYHMRKILSRMKFFGTVKTTKLWLHDCTPEMVDRESIRLYLCNVLQYGAKVGHGLKVDLMLDRPDPTYLHVRGLKTPDPEATLFIFPPGGAQAPTSILRGLPLERTIQFKTNSLQMEEMPNLERLQLESVGVSDGFLLSRPDGPNGRERLFPSLQKLYLLGDVPRNDNWDPLIYYLDHRRVFLHVNSYICSEAKKKIWPLVTGITDTIDREWRPKLA